MAALLSEVMSFCITLLPKWSLSASVTSAVHLQDGVQWQWQAAMGAGSGS